MTSPGRADDPYGRVEAAHEMARASTTGTGWRRRVARTIVLSILLLISLVIVVGAIQILAG